MSIRIKNKTIAALTVICLLLLSGCSDIGFSDTNIMRPPRATGDKAEIQDIIAEQAGGEYTLKYPQTGDYRSAIIMYDDSEGDREFTVVFYSVESDSDLYMLIISCEDDEWECEGKFVNSGASIERVMFEDINGNGDDEILVGWNNYNSTLKSLTAYCFDGDGVREMIVDDTYDSIVVNDITGNGVNDIILLSLSTNDSSSNAKLIQYSEAEKRPISKFYLELDPNVTSFENVTFSKIDDNKNGIVIDGEKSGGVLCTQVIYYDEDTSELLNPLVTESGGTYSNATTRKDVILCRDIDSDGIIEIPVTNQMSASSEEDVSTICTVTSWKQLSTSDGALQTKLNTIMNYTDGYYFIIPDRWNTTVTARIDTDNRKLTFYMWNTNTNSAGDELLRIFRFTQSDWDNMDTTGFILLDDLNGGTSGAVFAAEILQTNANDEINITQAELEQSVKLIS